jgi:tetratricopeptide (TPR) repeat protein
MRRPLLVCAAALVLASCGAGTDSAESQRDWLHVLSRKKAAAAPSATTSAKQAYADTLGAFVQKHPQHARARTVYQRIQLDFANELASLGRYQDAIRFYRAVAAADPQNEEATRGLANAVDRLAVSKKKLLALEKGMSQHDVAQLLGKPIPGWKAKSERRDPAIEAWYYRTQEGGVAGVYFRDGELFAAEENSHEKVAPLTR